MRGERPGLAGPEPIPPYQLEAQCQENSRRNERKDEVGKTSAPARSHSGRWYKDCAAVAGVRKTSDASPVDDLTPNRLPVGSGCQFDRQVAQAVGAITVGDHRHADLWLPEEDQQRRCTGLSTASVQNAQAVAGLIMPRQRPGDSFESHRLAATTDVLPYPRAELREI